MAVAHKGSISMGLVLIPINLHRATLDKDIHFNQLEKESSLFMGYSFMSFNINNYSLVYIRLRGVPNRNPLYTNCFFRLYSRQNKCDMYQTY